MLETREIWAALTEAHRQVAELKGLCESLPNQGILLDTLSIQEAKDSSEIENIITRHDELFISGDDSPVSPAAKEVRHYVSALRVGFSAVRSEGLIRLETLLAMQAELEQNRAGLRPPRGAILKNEATCQAIYEPPQDGTVVSSLMRNLIDFIHADDGLDPLLRMEIAHHQFESIHPFDDGNGRSGRVLNPLILQREGLRDLPNNLFRYPCTKIEFVERELEVSRVTAGKYLELLATAGFVRKQNVWKTNFHINGPLFELLSNINLKM